MYHGLHKYDLFKISRKKQEEIKTTDYREWNKDEKIKYYKTFDRNWGEYYMDCLKYLHEHYHIIYKNELEKIQTKQNKTNKQENKNNDILKEYYENNKSYIEACDMFYKVINS